MLFVKVFEPAGGALQLIRRADVVHEVTVDVTNNFFAGSILNKQAPVRGVRAAVTAKVQVPAVGGSDQAHVFALCFGAFTVTAGDTELELVG